MFEALERMPGWELERRWALVRSELEERVPEAGGLLTFSRVAIYYLTGTMAAGAAWLPKEGRPVLFVRRGLERAKLESPLADILPFRSFKDMPGLAGEAGSPMKGRVACETAGLSWALGQGLKTRLKDLDFVSGDEVLAVAMSCKTPWELSKMRLAGARHHECLHDVLPPLLHPGMSEREISHRVWETFFSRGHSGLMRMGAFGEEIFLGHVAAGDSGNYPSSFNGPLGLRGEHPAAQGMGNAGKVWQEGEPLALDVGFVLEGYHTDKTQVLWGGSAHSIPDDVRRAHGFCVNIQNWIAERMQPGAVPSELYVRCLEQARRDGFADGFMGLGGNKVAFIGHGIGLTIDGWPVVAKGFDEPLREGQVMALEPKMGIEGLGMVGVENTFEVTPDGGRCLTGDEYGMIGVT